MITLFLLSLAFGIFFVLLAGFFISIIIIPISFVVEFIKTIVKRLYD